MTMSNKYWVEKKEKANQMEKDGLNINIQSC